MLEHTNADSDSNSDFNSDSDSDSGSDSDSDAPETHFWSLQVLYDDDEYEWLYV